MLKLLQGFRDFILRGNVVDLAVGIVIGAAFTGLVSNFTNSFINPLLKVVGGGEGEGKVAGSFKLRGVDFPWSDFVNGLITFAITAAVLYFLVVTPMNMVNERRKRREEATPSEIREEIRLLTEIRDSLVAANSVPKPRAAAKDEPADETA